MLDLMSGFGTQPTRRLSVGVSGFWGGPAASAAGLFLASRPEGFHLRALPEPYVNLSIHTAPDVRPLP
ncbi:MAG: hypothetical protein QOJ42_4257 [Acidobacteriaceae bacterium]|nr:hypothetical protein [Acidobacteriaceae bacterium]